MRLCFLAPANSIHSYRWVKFFAERGHEVSWLSLVPSEFPPLSSARFEVLCDRQGVQGLVTGILRLRRLLERIRPDVFHIHSAGTYGLVGSLSAPSTLITVLTAWGSDIIYGGRHPVKRLFVKHALRRANLLTCDAQHLKRAMEELGAESSKIQVIYFGIDTAKFLPGDDRDKVRADLGIGPRPTIISLRNFEPVYDVESLVRCVPLVVKEVPEALFLIVGRGSQFEQLKQLAKTLGVEGSVRFTGFVANDQLPRIISAMDVYVSTSLSDGGIAASTAEAMACGVPVVVTDSGENSFWINDDRNGCLVPVRSPEALARKIVWLLKDQNARREIGAKGRETICERNDYYGEMSRMEALYVQLMKSKSTQGGA